jgi:heme exporter protein C
MALKPHARRSRARLRRALGVGAGVATAALLLLGLVVAPPDAVQGQPQRLMYLHVPAAWVAYLTFGTVLVASVGYLWRRDLRWDARAQAAAELGTGLTALTLALGSLWGRPVWGVWWAWDPRLVSTAVLMLVYVGYLGARGLSADRHVNARRAAVIGVLGFVEVPVVHFSVLWWRSLHQPPTVIQAGAPPIAAPMLAALLTGVLAFTLLATWVYLRRLDQLTARFAAPDSGLPAAAAETSPGAAAAARTIHVTNGAPR